MTAPAPTDPATQPGTVPPRAGCTACAPDCDCSATTFDARGPAFAPADGVTLLPGWTPAP